MWLLSTMGCTVTASSGPCAAYTCAMVAPTDDPGPLHVELPRGVSIDGVLTDGYVGDVTTSLIGGVAPGAALMPGDVVAFSSDGAEVPSFTGSVTAPPPPSGLTLPTTIARSSDLVITWSANAGERVSVVVMDPPFTTMPPRRAVWCIVPATSRSLTMPSVTLAPFSVGENVTVSVSSQNVTPVIAGNYAIDLEATQTLSSMATIGP
jgi:hypothetical protein